MAISAKQPLPTTLRRYNPSHRRLQAVITDNADFALDKPSDAQHLTFEGQLYPAFIGHDDYGITLFRFDSTSAWVEWVDTHFDGDTVDAALFLAGPVQRRISR